MIPKLFAAGETAFTSVGIGYMSDVLTCQMAEILNGEYTITLTYPTTGILYGELAEEKIILAKTPKPSYSGWTEQPFRIKSISRPLNGVVTVYAEHISYDLSGVIVPAMETGSHTYAYSFANEYYAANLNEDTRFTFAGSRHMSSSKKIPFTLPMSMRSHIGGAENSILDAVGAEIEWDRWNVRFHEARGTISDYVVRYGVDLLTLQIDTNIAERYNAVYPYFAIETEKLEPYDDERDGDYKVGDIIIGANGVDIIQCREEATSSHLARWDVLVEDYDASAKYNVVQIPPYEEEGEVYDSPLIGIFPSSIDDSRIETLPLDMADVLPDGVTATPEHIETYANRYIASHSLGEIEPEITASFVPMWSVDGYADKGYHPLGIGDTVRIVSPPQRANLTAEIVGYQFDVLAEIYTRIDVGKIKRNIADTISEIQKIVRLKNDN